MGENEDLESVVHDWQLSPSQYFKYKRNNRW